MIYFWFLRVMRFLVLWSVVLRFSFLWLKIRGGGIVLLLRLHGILGFIVLCTLGAFSLLIPDETAEAVGVA